MFQKKGDIVIINALINRAAVGGITTIGVKLHSADQLSYLYGVLRINYTKSPLAHYSKHEDRFSKGLTTSAESTAMILMNAHYVAEGRATGV